MSTKAHEVELTIDESKEFLYHIIDNNRVIQAQGKTPVAVEIRGESGIGKTSASLQVAKERKLNHVKLNLAQIEEIGDLVGFPMMEFEMIPPARKTEVTFKEGKPVAPEKTEDAPVKNEWVSEKVLKNFSDMGYKPTGRNRMSYAAPEWIANKTGGGILILDDWNRADTRHIQACMEIIDRQEYISWKLPEDWHIILTANPDDGEYLVQQIDNAQRTRFVRINMKFDKDCWARWAETAQIDGRCINFLLKHPDLVKNGVNPRSITTFFNSITSIKDFGQPESLSLIQMIGEGSVGPEFASLFTQFIENKLDKLIAPDTILLHENEQYVIGEIRKCTGGKVGENGYRADIASILTTRVINYTVAYAEKNPITKKIEDRLKRLMLDEDTLTNDLKFLMIRVLLNENKSKFQNLILDPKVMKMTVN